MAIVAGHSDDGWVVLDTESKDAPPPSAPSATTTGKPGPVPTLPSTASVFFDGQRVRPETSVYRVAVKKDSSLGHVRELTRDLDHLERTIAERPPLVTPSRRGAVDDLVHKLIDEAWSLMLDKPFEEDGRALTGRALALAAALDWPGAAEQAAAVLDDVIKRKPSRADAPVARASLLLLEGEPDKAVSLAEAATANPDVSPRVRYVIGRGPPGGGEEGRGAGGDEALPRGRPGRSAREAARGDGGPRAGPRAAAQADGRRALLGHARTRPAAQRDVRLRSGLAAHLANRRRAIRARNGPHRRVRDRPRVPRGLRDGTRRGVAGGAQPGRRGSGRAREEGRPQHVPRREAEDAAPRCCRAASASSSARERRNRSGKARSRPSSATARSPSWS